MPTVGTHERCQREALALVRAIMKQDFEGADLIVASLGDDLYREMIYVLAKRFVSLLSAQGIKPNWPWHDERLVKADVPPACAA